MTPIPELNAKVKGNIKRGKGKHIRSQSAAGLCLQGRFAKAIWRCYTPAVAATRIPRRPARRAGSLIVIAAALLISCAGKGSGSGGRISVEFSFGAEDIDIYHAMEASIVKAVEASKQDISLSFSYAYASTPLQLTNIRDSIRKKPTILIIMPQDSKAVLPLIGEAHAAGIKVIVYNRQTFPDPNIVPDAYIGLDTVDQGYTTGFALIKRMKEAGVPARIINVMGSLGDRNALNRSEGLKRAAAEMGAGIVAEVGTDWRPEQAESGLDAALAAHPEATAVFCASDWLMSGVERSLRKIGRWEPRGKPGHFFLGSQDVFPNGEPLIRAGYIDVDTAYDIGPMTSLLLQAILSIGNGKTMSQDVFLVPGRVVTPSNIDTMDDLWSLTFNRRQ
jgi:ABC-type sugar transport system substrate-binding protein